MPWGPAFLGESQGSALSKWCGWLWVHRPGLWFSWPGWGCLLHLQGRPSSLPVQGTTSLQVGTGCGWSWGTNAASGAEGQRGVTMASWGQQTPSPSSQAGNNPVSWDWGPRQILKLLASVSAHLELSSLQGPREPCARLQLLETSLHLQAAVPSLGWNHSPGITTRCARWRGLSQPWVRVDSSGFSVALQTLSP